MKGDDTMKIYTQTNENTLKETFSFLNWRIQIKTIEIKNFKKFVENCLENMYMYHTIHKYVCMCMYILKYISEAGTPAFSEAECLKYY